MNMDHQDREKICRSFYSALDAPPIPDEIKHIPIREFMEGIFRYVTCYENALCECPSSTRGAGSQWAMVGQPHRYGRKAP